MGPKKSCLCTIGGNVILWPPNVKNWLIGKDPVAEKDWRQEENGTIECEMVGWHHQLNGYEFEQALGVGDNRKPGVLQSMGLQRVGHDWVSERNWSYYYFHYIRKTQAWVWIPIVNYIICEVGKTRNLVKTKGVLPKRRIFYWMCLSQIFENHCSVT